MDNVIAIEIITQHIKIQLDEFFKNYLSKPTNLIEKKIAIELIDSRNFGFAEIVSILDTKNNKSSIQILEDIINGNGLNYSEIFKNTLLDSLLKLLVKKFNITKYPFLFLSDEKVNIIDNCNNIIYFKSTIVNNDDVEKIKKNIISANLLEEKKNIYIVSLVISPSCVEKVLTENEKVKIYFISLFMTTMFKSFEEIFSKVKDEFSNHNLNESFSDMINFISTIKDQNK